MIERFAGPDRKAVLVDALRGQAVIHGNAEVAERLTAVVDLAEYEPSKPIITQDAQDTDLFFILAGRVSVVVLGREVAVRKAGLHVGEMTTIDPRARRCASVIALETTVVAKVSERNFTALAEEYPDLWRLIALELAERLRERNDLVRPPNPRPVLFIGSSKESIPIMRAVHAGLEHDDIIVRPWTTDQLFGPSRFPIEDLEREVKSADFALLIIGPDDKVISRKDVESDAPRDNVVFELGLFMGQLWRNRTFMLQPRGVELKMPSDLLGLMPIEYAPPIRPEDLASTIAPACDKLRAIVAKEGVR